MARADYYNRVKDILYGTELGEQPPLVVAASNANESVAGNLATFTLASSEGAKCTVGNVLAADDPADTANCHAVYVTTISTDTITGVNGFRGSPVVVGSDSGDLDNMVIEINPLVPGHKIHSAIDTIFAVGLWPDVFNIEQRSYTPVLSTGQVDLESTVQEIIYAHQVIGGFDTTIPFDVMRNVHSTIAANNVRGWFDAIDGSTVYATTVEKFVIGDEDEDVNGLIEIVSTGAAALCLGASVSETNMAKSVRDSRERGQRDVASQLWRDFLTLRTGLSEGLSREFGDKFYYDRG